jgi:PhnB protein
MRPRSHDPETTTMSAPSSPGPFEANIAPWLAVSDAQKAVDYYRAAFGAVELDRLDDDGKLAVARLSVTGAVFWVQDDFDASPEARGPGSVRMILSVDDPDSVFDRAVAAGATEVAPVSEDHGWRIGRVSDPFGHDWEIGKQLTS